MRWHGPRDAQACAARGQRLLCDGEAAFQTVFRFHLHVIPRYPGDGWTIQPESQARDWSLLDRDVQTIKDATASTD